MAALHLLLRLLAIAAVVLAAGGVVRADAPGEGAPALARTLGAALRSTKPFILVVEPTSPPRDVVASEAYADWSSYLEESIPFRPPGTPLVRTSANEYRRRVPAPALPSGFGTLFVRGDRSALAHPGLVLEPRIYEIGYAFMVGAELNVEAERYGLRRVRLRPQ